MLISLELKKAWTSRLIELLALWLILNI